MATMFQKVRDARIRRENDPVASANMRAGFARMREKARERRLKLEVAGKERLVDDMDRTDRRPFPFGGKRLGGRRSVLLDSPGQRWWRPNINGPEDIERQVREAKMKQQVRRGPGPRTTDVRPEDSPDYVESVRRRATEEYNENARRRAQGGMQTKDMRPTDNPYYVQEQVRRAQERYNRRQNPTEFDLMIRNARANAKARREAAQQAAPAGQVSAGPQPVAPTPPLPVPQAAPAPAPAPVAQPAPLPQPAPAPSGLAQPSTNAFPQDQVQQQPPVNRPPNPLIKRNPFPPSGAAY